MLKEASKASGISKRGQQHHGQGKTVHAQVEGGIDGRDTRYIVPRIDSRAAQALNCVHRNNGQHKWDQASTHRRPADGLQVILGQEQDNHSRQDREEQDECQEYVD